MKSVQRFDFYLQGVKCTLRCHHKCLEPFLSRVRQIAKLDRWAMLLQEYDITFIHIRGKDNILADAISQLHTINIYEDPAEDRSLHSPTTQNKACSSKATTSIQLLDSGTAQQLLNVTTTMLQNLQKQDKFCRKKVCELLTGLKNHFYLYSKNILKRKIIVNTLEINAIVVPASLIYTLLYEFHNWKVIKGQPEHQHAETKILVERHEVRCKKPHQQLHYLF